MLTKPPKAQPVRKRSGKRTAGSEGCKQPFRDHLWREAYIYNSIQVYIASAEGAQALRLKDRGATQAWFAELILCRPFLFIQPEKAASNEQ